MDLDTQIERIIAKHGSRADAYRALADREYHARTWQSMQILRDFMVMLRDEDRECGCSRCSAARRRSGYED